MTEARFQSKLLKALRQHPALKDGVVVKLNDRFTRGLPDVMVSICGVTTFFELKVSPNIPSKIQHYFLGKLAPRAFVVTRLRNGDVTLHHYMATNQVITGFNDAVIEIVRRCIDAA